VSLININLAWCKSCGICVDFCPNSVLVSDEEANPKVVNKEACTKCKLCELRCPDFAIDIKEEVEE